MFDFILANYVCNLEAARVAARGPRAVRHSHLPGVWPEVRGDANAGGRRVAAQASPRVRPDHFGPSRRSGRAFKDTGHHALPGKL